MFYANGSFLTRRGFAEDVRGWRDDVIDSIGGHGSGGVYHVPLDVCDGVTLLQP